jgi:predicted metal-binding membrane protein
MDVVSVSTNPNVARRMISGRGFFTVSALLFAASTAATILWCAPMSDMGGMPMPGGWTMSMAWMRMPGQGWPGAAATFLGMWAAMMVAMMLPSLVPMLQPYRQSIIVADRSQLGRLTALVAAAYFSVWILVGILVYALGVTLAALQMWQPMLARAVPITAGVVVLIGGVLQFTDWKRRSLACYRAASECGRRVPPEARLAWRHGVRLGLHCGHCCSNLTAILLVIGVMDLRAMGLVAAATTLERLAGIGERAARTTGALILGAGSFLIARAVGLG